MTISNIAGALYRLNELSRSPVDACRLDPDLEGIRTAFQKLSTIHSNLLRPRYVHRLSISEIASKYDCSETSVLSWLESAVKAFAQQLERDSVTAGGRPASKSARKTQTDNDQTNLFTSCEN